MELPFLTYEEARRYIEAGIAPCNANKPFSQQIATRIIFPSEEYNAPAAVMRTYKGRKSPSISAKSVKVGTRKRGNDGKMWQVRSVTSRGKKNSTLVQRLGDSMKKLSKEFYAKEKKPIHIIGYTVALGMMGIGVAETVHSLPYIVKGESNLVGIILGLLGIVAGGVVAFCLLERSRSCLLMVTNKNVISTYCHFNLGGLTNEIR